MQVRRVSRTDSSRKEEGCGTVAAYMCALGGQLDGENAARCSPAALTAALLHILHSGSQTSQTQPNPASPSSGPPPSQAASHPAPFTIVPDSPMIGLAAGRYARAQKRKRMAPPAFFMAVVGRPKLVRGRGELPERRARTPPPHWSTLLQRAIGNYQDQSSREKHEPTKIAIGEATAGPRRCRSLFGGFEALIRRYHCPRPQRKFPPSPASPLAEAP